MNSTEEDSHPRWKQKVRKILLRRVPVIRWLSGYRKVDLVSDFIAGITIGLTLIPQSIAYASLAGLSPKFGLNSTFVGCFVYAIFGTIKEVSIGPTSLMALLTFEYTRDLTPDFVIVLTFVAGVVEFLMGMLKLGFLVNFISTPVTSGFTTATSIIIIVSQLKGILGVRFKSCGFIDNIMELIIHASETRFAADFALGLSCIVVLLVLRQLKNIEIVGKTSGRRALKKILWFISIGRNTLVVLISCCIAAWFEINHGTVPFLLSRSVSSGIPPFRLPPTDAVVANQTYNSVQMVEELGSAIFIVPIVSVLANIAIAKAFATGESIDATQEMLTLSLCNVLGSCFGSMPTCGAFTRSAVSSASGVASPLAGIFSGCLSLFALNFLTQYFHLIPRATLSAILICAVIFLIDWEIIMPLWRMNKRDLCTLILTLITCLCFGVEIGLLIGVTMNLAHLLYLWARPSIHKECQKSPNNGVEYVLVTPDKGFFFPAVDQLQTSVLAVMNGNNRNKAIVINCIHFTGIDYTAAKSLTGLVKYFEDNERRLIFINLNDDIRTMCLTVGCKTMVCCQDLQHLAQYLSGDNEYGDISKCETIPLLLSHHNNQNIVK